MSIILSINSSFFFLLLLPLALTSASFPQGKETSTHLHFFVHDKFISPNASVVKVAEAPNSTLPTVSGFQFGSVYVFDDLVTAGPNLTSKRLGRARGFNTVSSLDGSELFLTIEIRFTEGDYKGSSIVISGGDPLLVGVREIPVVGGTAFFRLARGFAFTKPYFSDAKTGIVIFDWNVHVFHH